MKTFKSLMFAVALGLAPAAVGATAVPAAQATGEVAAAASPESGAQAPAPAETAPAVAAAKADIAHAPPTPRIGQPIFGSTQLQPQVTDIGRDAQWMHNVVLMPIITGISVLVLALLLWTVIRFRRSANPTPSRTSHNTVIEVLWTVAPVLLLLIIAVPSIKLLAKQYAPPKADLTVKVIGNQWYWTYQYPDNGDFEIVSNMLKEKDDPGLAAGAHARTDADGPRLLAVDERMVVPAGAVVKLIVTSNDVIHSFGLPAFWTKMDAVPGKLNETWFKVDRPGVYFGQCSELCGARHAFMPIAVEVVPPAQFAAWVAAKGGTIGAAKPNPDATATSPITNPGVGNAPPGSVPEMNKTDAPTPGTVTPPTSAQGATNNGPSETGMGK